MRPLTRGGHCGLNAAQAETPSGRAWVHACCARWIPETRFGNAAFLEPVLGLEDVDRDRFKLTCYLCGKRNAGACIQVHPPASLVSHPCSAPEAAAHPGPLQCMKTNCYEAFHVCCAVQVGLTMREELNPATNARMPMYYCHKHTPKVENSPQAGASARAVTCFARTDAGCPPSASAFGEGGRGQPGAGPRCCSPGALPGFLCSRPEALVGFLCL
jgi:hypothetical protein